ncbi:PTS sugar transporter subunit IIC [Tannockella kyphosi]|uniref:PTS sugar transporter subunit IIC n=1 Tax=Tannockella kyphosi TaxID=2899121 RepID=UPI002011984C|nr:PTS transporter subunit EIIC [Tannockella kyphosi]
MREFIADTLLPKLGKISEHRFIKSIQQGAMGALTITMISSVVSIIKTPPFSASNTTNGILIAWSEFATAYATELTLFYNVTMGMIGIFVLFGVIYKMSSYYKMNPLNPTIMGTVSFLMLTVDFGTITDTSTASMSITYLGAQGMFSAFVIGIVVVELLNVLGQSKFKISMPPSVPAMVSDTFAALIPSTVVFVIFIGIRCVFNSLGFLFPAFVLQILSPFLQASDSLGAVILLYSFARILWWLGIHGTSIINSVVQPLIAYNIAANLEAYNLGLELPYTFTAVIPIFEIGTISTCIAILLVCKSERLKAVAKVGFVPSIFKISEPVIFGMPLVYNFKLFIPFFLTHVSGVATAYVFMSSGLINKAIFAFPFTLPGPINATLATLDWKAGALWMVLLVIQVLMYIPFLKSYDKDILLEESASGE